MNASRRRQSANPEQVQLPLWSRAIEASEHDAEDRRAIVAVNAFRSIAGPGWRGVAPSLSQRLQNHVAVGDCPLGVLQAGGLARLYGIRA